MKRYDYIITGAGAAGLSLLMHFIRSGKFQNKKILLTDKVAKTKNDRTWCFWEKEAGIFEDIVYKRWNRLWFHTKDHSLLHDITPYQYKLIRGIDFYNYCFDSINKQPNIDIRYGNVEACCSNENETYIIIDSEKIYAGYIFNSILFEKPGSGTHHCMLQHFRGWVIETKSAAFTTGEAVLMDFRVDQQQGTTFVYVMPFSSTEALVEYTLFSGEVLPAEVYDAGLKEYCSEQLGLQEYSILSQEYGIIPMTDYPFKKRIHNIINIGTAGGQTKPSSGYTFRFIQKNSERITASLIKTEKPFVQDSFADKRFKLYDSTLLNILSKNKLKGEEIFSTLMKCNKMKDVMKFLDNETSLSDELKIISPLPKKIFMKAAWESLTGA